LLTIALCLGGGCRPPPRDHDTGRPPLASPQIVKFWHFWGGEDRQLVDEIVARFNRSQSLYQVRAIAMPGSNLDLKFFLSVAGHDPPDLLSHDDPVMADWAHRGVLMPLAQLAGGDPPLRFDQWLLPAARKLAKYRGNYYALPSGLDLRALYCNQTLLAEHGLDLPSTLDDLDRIADTLAPPGAKAPYQRMGYLPDPRRLWAWGPVFGGTFYNPNAPTLEESITADSPPIVAALGWMARYSQRYGAAQVAAFRAGEQAVTGAAFPLLANRRYAVIMDGQWRLRDLAHAAAADRPEFGQPDQFAVVPLPPPVNGVSQAGWVNANFFVVPQTAACPHGAWQFMRFWTGLDGDFDRAATFCIRGGWIPPAQAIIDSSTYRSARQTQPLLQTFVDLAASDHQFPTPVIPTASFYYRQVSEAAQHLLYRDPYADPRDILKAAADRSRQRLRAVLARPEIMP
jgi:multiple sugar transport system substrate-binding protein